jgi:hypothetical protein
VIGEQPLRIRCAQCGRQVDRHEVWFSPARNAWRITAECHGDRDECWIDQLAFDVREIEGVAFAVKRIEQVKERGHDERISMPMSG